MKCSYQSNVKNSRKMNSNYKSSLNKYSKLIRTEYIIRKRIILYYVFFNVLFFVCFIFIFTRSNHGQFYETFKNKPNIISICNKRLNRSLYEHEIRCNSNDVNNIYVNDQNILIDNYNNDIDYFNDCVKNDNLNNSEQININNEIINTKCSVLLRKQRVLYEEKADAVTTSEGASETLGDIRNKLKTRTETPDGITYDNSMYGPMKGKIDNLSNKQNKLRLPNKVEHEKKLNPPTNTNDTRKINKTNFKPKPKVINFTHGGMNNKRIVEYEVVPKIVTTKDEGNRKINRVEYELRAKYETTKNSEENNNDTTTNDISPKMETKNEYVIGNSNGTNEVKEEKMNITQQSRLNNKCSNMNGVNLVVPTTKQNELKNPCNNNQMKEGINPFIDDDVNDKKDNLQDSYRVLKKGTNPFIDEDELEEILKQEREEKIRNEKKKSRRHKKNKKNITNKLDSPNVPNIQCNKNVNLKKSNNETKETSNINTSMDYKVKKKNYDENNNSVKNSKFKDVLLDVAKDIENGITSDMLNNNQQRKNLKSESIKQNELENKSARNMDDSKNLFENGYDLKTESERFFNRTKESGLYYTDEYESELNKEYDSYSDRGSTSMEYDEYYGEYCDYDVYDDNYVGNPMKLFTSDIMSKYGNIKSGLKHNTNKIAKTVLKSIDDIEDEGPSIKEKNKNNNNKKKNKIVIDKEDISDNVSVNSTDSEGYYNNEDYYRNANYYGSQHYYDSDMYSNSDDSDSDDGNPISVLASEIVDAYGNIKGGALKVKDLITEGGPQLLDMTANMVGNKTKDGLNKVKEIVSKKCGIDVESDIDLETETNPLKWHEVIRKKYRKLHFGWKLFLNIGPPAVLAIIGGVVAGVTGGTGFCSIPFVAMAAILFFQVYRLTKKHYYSKKKIGIKNLF
ncbi:Plasmodium exported protein (hyp17), unknown function [Plasmodium sp. gorilla clade G2]|uniref:Plasmodium exported protein (hyp17), unknown function n=1 Tax=Plasmodium sp. gorilla clade G2 TaxID=880535 RepID=UPI000D22BF0A|nr:Plasmodium exported protein (hyp17), unknown function [Plasmodium sp. gorilla clade G2]SOV19985.1 Plasmodium exported protein (hyp17), unknown function [Plasmodium sp. gorilla clade G2]